MENWIYDNKTYSGYRIYKSYDDPMYSSDFYYVVSQKRPAEPKYPNGRYSKPYMITQRLNCYPYDDVDDDGVYEVIKKYIAKYLPENSLDIDETSKDFKTIILGDDFEQEIKQYFYYYKK